MPDSASASQIGSACTPGSPNTTSIPAASSVATRAAAPFAAVPAGGSLMLTVAGWLLGLGDVGDQSVHLVGGEAREVGHDRLVARHDVRLRVFDRLLDVGVDRLAGLLRVGGDVVEVRPLLAVRPGRLE